MTNLKNTILSEDPELIRRELRDPERVCDDGQRPLSLAAGVGVLDLIDLLVDIGVPIDAQDANDLGYTALCTAAREGRTAAMESLLALGADVNAGDSIGGTPLHHAAVVGQAAAARILLAAGARADAPDDRGVTPLIRVAVHTDAAQVRLLDSSGLEGEPVAHPLHEAHLETADVLLAAGADVDHIAGYGYAALHHAAENGAVPLMERLLRAGARAGLANGKGFTPIHAACDRSQAAAVRLLLGAGADPDAQDAYGFVPLHGAAVQGSAEIAQALLDAGADRTLLTEDGYDKVTAGMTPADAATAYGHDELAELLRA